MIIQTTALSSVHFVPADTLQIGLYIERQRHRMAINGKDYQQRVCSADPLLIQFHAATTATSFRLHFYNQSGVKVKTRVATTAYVNIAGNSAKDAAGNTVSLRTFTRVFSFAQEFLPEGVYTIVCEVNDATFLPNGFPASVRYLISEPLWVKKRWPGTVLFSYRNRTNEGDFVWEQTGATGSLRVSGVVREADMDSVTESYKEGSYDPIQLSSFPTTSYELSTVPLPLFLREKLNRIFACSEVAIDGRAVVKTGKPQQSDSIEHLRTFSQLYESRHASNEWLSGSGWGGVAMRLPTSDLGKMNMPNIYFPYVAAYLKIGNVSYAVSWIGQGGQQMQGWLVQNAQDLEGLTDILNADAIDTYGLGGYFEHRDGIVSYISNGVEALKEVELVLLTDHVEMWITSSFTSNVPISASANGEAIAIQPDKNSSAILLSALQSNPSATTSLTYNYPTGQGGDTVRVFTGRKTTSVKVKWQANRVKLRPGNWTSFWGVFSGMTSFNMNALSETSSNLQTLILQGAYLSGVTGLGSYWPMLESITIQGTLDTSAVNAVIYDVAALIGNTGVQGGSLVLDSQAPPAAPAGTGSQNNIAYIRGQGWRVIHD